MTPAGPPTRRRKPRRRLSRKQQQRRTFLRSALIGGGLLLLHPLANLALVRRALKRLRPPGSLEEKAFLGACIKCGQCVQVCPVEAITFDDLDAGFGSAAPRIDARAQACDFSCDALSCILACPTGALSHDVRTKEEVRIGVAKLAHPETCLARQGKGWSGIARGAGYRGRLRYEEIDRWNSIAVSDHPYDRRPCDLCVIECPIGETAIRLEKLPPRVPGQAGEPERWTPVVRDGCVGCGVCEMICPTEPGCIEIEPGVVA